MLFFHLCNTVTFPKLESLEYDLFVCLFVSILNYILYMSYYETCEDLHLIKVFAHMSSIYMHQVSDFW